MVVPVIRIPVLSPELPCWLGPRIAPTPGAVDGGGGRTFRPGVAHLPARPSTEPPLHKSNHRRCALLLKTGRRVLLIPGMFKRPQSLQGVPPPPLGRQGLGVGRKRLDCHDPSQGGDCVTGDGGFHGS